MEAVLAFYNIFIYNMGIECKHLFAIERIFLEPGSRYKRSAA